MCCSATMGWLARFVSFVEHVLCPNEIPLKARNIMTTRRRAIVSIIAVLALLRGLVVAGAQATQEKKARQDVQVVTVQSGSGSGAGVGVGLEPGGFAYTAGQGDATFVFVSTEMSIDGKVVKGAPYSAQAVTE